MIFHFQLGGFGLTLEVLHFDIIQMRLTILSWRIIRKYELWRAEIHSRGDEGYRYQCTKNGRIVEEISFRSPIVKHV